MNTTKHPEQPVDLLKWALDEFHPKIALACSFSIEDVAIAHMLKNINSDARIFALDTGRLNEETYQCAESLRRQFGINIVWYFPKLEDVQKLESANGVYSFKESIDARRQCCGIRKVEPLNRALSGLTAWITGMRREQSITRIQLKQVETDEAHGGITKINPLASWKSDDVWAYIKKNNLPFNRLYDNGYQSIGCEPCTRAVKPGEDSRAGRWWWESPEHKECGLHIAKQGAEH